MLKRNRCYPSLCMVSDKIIFHYEKKKGNECFFVPCFGCKFKLLSLFDHRKKKVKCKSAMVCAGCKDAFYCSVECQKNDWNNHREACQRIKTIRKSIMFKGREFLDVQNSLGDDESPRIFSIKRMNKSKVNVYYCDGNGIITTDVPEFAKNLFYKENNKIIVHYKFKDKIYYTLATFYTDKHFVIHGTLLGMFLK